MLTKLFEFADWSHNKAWRGDSFGYFCLHLFVVMPLWMLLVFTPVVLLAIVLVIGCLVGMAVLAPIVGVQMAYEKLRG